MEPSFPAFFVATLRATAPSVSQGARSGLVAPEGSFHVSRHLSKPGPAHLERKKGLERVLPDPVLSTVRLTGEGWPAQSSFSSASFRRGPHHRRVEYQQAFADDAVTLPEVKLYLAELDETPHILSAN